MQAHVRGTLHKVLNKMDHIAKEEKEKHLSSHTATDSYLVPRALSSSSLEEYVNIEAINPQGMSIHFKMKTNSPIEKLMRAYCSRENLPPHSVAFLYNGVRIDPHDTPRSVRPLKLGMQNKDIIDILLDKDWSEHFAITKSANRPINLSSFHHPSMSVPANLLNQSLERKKIEMLRRGDSGIPSEQKILLKASEESKIPHEGYKEKKSPRRIKEKAKKKEVIRSDDVIRMGNIAFITGCFGDHVNNNNNNNDDDDNNINNIFENQCKNALNDLKSKVEKAGMRLKDVGRIRVYFLNITNYDDFFTVAKSFFGKYMPIITAVEVARLRRPHALLEIEADLVHTH